jgi:formylglycine-generating enzyme required for sulfatase activity
MFVMGNSSDRTKKWYEDVPPVEVTITKPFWIASAEATQAAYRKVMGENPSFYKGDDLPVDSVTWNDAQQYCHAVGGRLPTEAEWEYAARAGLTSDRYGDLDQTAWYEGNSGRHTHTVKSKAPNAVGMFDVLGNVGEWTATIYDTQPQGGTNPQGRSTGEGHVLRGGAWDYPPTSMTFWDRAWAPDKNRLSNVGFRCVLDSN